MTPQMARRVNGKKEISVNGKKEISASSAVRNVEADS